MQYEERFAMKTQNFKDANIPHWGGGVIALSVHFLRGGHQNACRMRAGGGRGSKKAKKLRAHFMYGPQQACGGFVLR